jgi:murein DD-endopeptidase MepM/ murein hydrolase activator NlpD
VVIFGHSSRANVTPGQRVDAGSVIGYSGSMNGPHLHLEYRQKGHNTSSGFKVLDPSSMMGMQGSGVTGGGQQSAQQSNPFAPKSFGTPSWYGGGNVFGGSSGGYTPGSIVRMRGGY